MKLRATFSALALYALLAACVTINIYFPAAAAEKVADEIIEEIQNEESNNQQQVPDDKQLTPEDDPFSSNQHGVIESIAVALLNTLVSQAHAEEVDLNADSAEVRKLKASMRARYNALKEFYANGSVGILNNGLIAVRNPGSIPLSIRNQVNQLVNTENSDRRKLYQAIATANGHPEWAQQIQQTFARRWIAKAQPGWWYKDGSGWKQK